MPRHPELFAEFEAHALANRDAQSLMQLICDRLHGELARYNWVGFYVVPKDEPKTLVLGPYSGTSTPHKRIAFGVGLCGSVAINRQTLVINDVSTDPRYLMGSEHTKSEIIVPMIARNEIVGEFDINSYFRDTWTKQETTFVESCAALVGKLL